MSLADHYGGGYFPEGKHRVSISGTRFFAYNSGSAGVEFSIGDGRRGGKFAFCLHEKALWKLANFAADLGITPEAMRTIDPERRRGFESFIGKSFIAVVGKEKADDGKEYATVVDWEPLPTGFDSRPAPTPPPSEPPQVAEDQVPATAGYLEENAPPPTGNDIPF